MGADLPAATIVDFIIGDFEAAWGALAAEPDARHRGNFLFGLQSVVLLEVGSRRCASASSGEAIRDFCKELHYREPFDQAKAERGVMLVLDDFMAAFNRQDVAAQERTYQFPYYQLVNDRMAVLNEPGAQAQTDLNATDQARRDAGWDHRALVGRPLC